jgi:anthranilate phosphoribosyltransferase
VQIETTPDVMAAALREAGLVFMFAPLMHPAMRHVGPVRRELGIPTVMNIVGPLANPASAGRQVIGVAEERRLPLIAGALAALGSEHALIVHGAPGLDEVSPLGPTRVIEVRGATTREWRIDPAELGIEAVRAEELAGAEPRDNAAVIDAVLAGRGNAGATAAVVLNAAAAIYVAGDAETFPRAYDRARDALLAGEGARALERLRRAFARPPQAV